MPNQIEQVISLAVSAPTARSLQSKLASPIKRCHRPTNLVPLLQNLAMMRQNPEKSNLRVKEMIQGVPVQMPVRKDPFGSIRAKRVAIPSVQCQAWAKAMLAWSYQMQTRMTPNTQAHAMTTTSRCGKSRSPGDLGPNK